MVAREHGVQVIELQPARHDPLDKQLRQRRGIGAFQLHAYLCELALDGFAKKEVGARQQIQPSVLSDQRQIAGVAEVIGIFVQGFVRFGSAVRSPRRTPDDRM